VVSAPGKPGAPPASPGVRLNRGAAAGCTTPSTDVNVPRLTLCGCAGASPRVSTGAKQVSVPSSSARHSASVFVLNTSATAVRADGHDEGSACESSSDEGSPSRRSSDA
jgi:hypothetical protein